MARVEIARGPTWGGLARLASSRCAVTESDGPLGQNSYPGVGTTRPAAAPAATKRPPNKTTHPTAQTARPPESPTRMAQMQGSSNSSSNNNKMADRPTNKRQHSARPTGRWGWPTDRPIGYTCTHIYDFQGYGSNFRVWILAMRIN